MGVFGAVFGRRGDVGFSSPLLGASSGVVGFNVAMFLSPVRAICRPASPAPPAGREIVRPAHEKWLKMGVLWRAGRTSSRKCRWRGCVGRVFSRNCCGMVRWASFSRNRRPSWWACGAAAVAAAAPHQLGTNFACNSPTTLSNHEFTTLELQRFQTLLKLHPIELHATCEGRAGYALLTGLVMALDWRRCCPTPRHTVGSCE